MKRRDILKALVVLPIVPISLVDSIALNVHLKYIVRTFIQAGYQVTKSKDTFSKIIYCLLDPNEIFKIPNPQSGFSNQSRLLEIGMFEKVDRQFIAELEKYNRESRQDGCQGDIVPKQSEIGTFVFGNLEGTLPKQFKHLFSHIYEW